jgi:hypothetical protein
MTFHWTKQTYEASVSSRCWWFTPYDGGWDYRDGWEESTPAQDRELRAIVELETELRPLPDWAIKIADTSIRFVPPCGHYTFPKAYLETVDAIGLKRPQTFLHTCYTVGPDRKQQMADYCLCLDAWLGGTAPDVPARELAMLGSRKIDWLTVCQSLWQVLGEHTELKDLLVERTLIQTRWWIKSAVWDDDFATRFGRSEYLGDYADTGCFASDNGNPDLTAPTFRLQAAPRVQKIEKRLESICPDWPWFRGLIIDGSWPCAPKTFRYLERLLWSIGKERPAVSLPSFPLENADAVPDFLLAADTCTDPHQAAHWWQDFLAALSAWWQDKPTAGSIGKYVTARLGEPEDVKRWLVRLYVHRLRLLAQHGATVGKLVGPSSGMDWGTKKLETG